MKDGYYWVRGEASCYDWVIAKLTGCDFLIDGVIINAWYVEIGDYIETPEKYKE